MSEIPGAGADGPLPEDGVPAPGLDEMVGALAFDDACLLVLGLLEQAVPLACWSVTRLVAGRQRHLVVHDDAYGTVAGATSLWANICCSVMVSGDGPQIAPDAAAVPGYAAAAAAAGVTIGTYVGVPLHDPDGRLYGTLLGADPEARGEDLHRHGPLFHAVGTLLEQVLQAERLLLVARGGRDQLRWRAVHDELTGLPNRASLLDRMRRAVDLGRRAPQPLAVLAFSFDDLGLFNDAFGRRAGDELLLEVAHRVRAAVRPGDTVARISGHAFGVLLEDGGDPHALAERIGRALDEPFTAEGTAVTVTVSTGIVQLAPRTWSGAPSPEQIAERALVDAANAVRLAKQGGPGTTRAHLPHGSPEESRHLRLRDPLRRAVATGGIEAHYQPVVELATGRPYGLEALARWTHQGTPVAPEEFIRMAGRGLLLPALTDHMLARATAQLATWNARLGHQQLHVAVNVPPLLMTDRAFPERVAARVEEHRLAADQLVLEITEDALLVDLVTARSVSAELRQAGACLSLDDFGAGYSSLLHLHEIPLQSVKIDRGFTSDLDTEPRTERFMSALLAFGADLGLQVVVEGVERARQAAILVALGCTHAQGYLFARPQPADALASALGLSPV